MHTTVLRLVAALVGLSLLSACASTQMTRRIEEKSEAFARLSPELQANIRQGIVELGYTADMAYMALGRPSKTSTINTTDGPVGVWTYDRIYPADPVVKMMPAQHSMAYAAPMVSPKAPFRTGFRTPGFGAAPPGNYGPQQSMEPADLAAETLYVLFYQGRVFEIKLAGAGG